MPFRQVLEKMDKMPFGLNIISPEEKKKPYDIHIDNRKVGEKHKPTSLAKLSHKQNYRRYLSKNEAKQKSSIQVNQEPDIINKIKSAFGLKQQEDNKNFQLVNTNPAPPSMANIITQQPETYSDNISNPPIFRNLGQDDADDLRQLIESNEEREGRQLTFNEKTQLKDFLLEQKAEAQASHLSRISDIQPAEIEEITSVEPQPRETRYQEANRKFQEQVTREIAQQEKERLAREEIAKAKFERDQAELAARERNFINDINRDIFSGFKKRNEGNERDVKAIRNAMREQVYDSLFGDISPSLETPRSPSPSASNPASPSVVGSSTAASRGTTEVFPSSESKETHPAEPAKGRGRPKGALGPAKTAEMMAAEASLKEKARLDALKALEAEGRVAARTAKKK